MEDHDSDAGKNTVVSYEILRAEGDVLCKQNEFTKAVSSYKQALTYIREGNEGENKGAHPPDITAEKLEKDEKDVLVNLSKCYLLLGNPDTSLDYAEEALQADKQQIRALYQKQKHYILRAISKLLLYFITVGINYVQSCKNSDLVSKRQWKLSIIAWELLNQ